MHSNWYFCSFLIFFIFRFFIWVSLAGQWVLIAYWLANFYSEVGLKYLEIFGSSKLANKAWEGAWFVVQRVYKSDPNFLLLQDFIFSWGWVYKWGTFQSLLNSILCFACKKASKFWVMCESLSKILMASLFPRPSC